MKYCKNCHRISKDDDFCSHCGSAVYGDDDYTEDISCSNVSEHSHDKESYSSPYSKHTSQGDGVPRRQDNGTRKKSGCSVYAAIFIFICIMLSVFGDIISSFFENL